MRQIDGTVAAYFLRVYRVQDMLSQALFPDTMNKRRSVHAGVPYGGSQYEPAETDDSI